MQNLFDFSIGTIPVSIASALLAVWGWVKIFANKRIDHEFNKRLEKHKSELQSLRDQNNFDFGRRLSDFNLYSTKKHESYREIYAGINAALHAAMTVSNYQEENYRGFGKSMIKQLLETINVPSETIEATLDAWTNEASYKDQLANLINKWLLANSRNHINKARDCFLDRSLYVSDHIDNKCYEIISTMNNYVDVIAELKYHTLEQGHRQQATNELRMHYDSMLKLLTEIKEQMRKEIKLGYYDDSVIAEN